MDNKTEENAKGMARLMEDGKGGDVSLLDIHELNGWTDYFVIATATSAAHMQGLAREAREYAAAHGMEAAKAVRKIPDGNEWSLLDFGDIVVHLMTREAREFYALEDFWRGGKALDWKE